MKPVPCGNTKNSKTRFLLVSRDLNDPDFFDHFEMMAAIAEDHHCETLVYALSTACDRGGKRPLTKIKIFGKTTKYLKNVILETGHLKREEQIRTQWWERDQVVPSEYIRRMATSTEPRANKERLLAELDQRQKDKTIILTCGEVNIIKTSRTTKAPVDEYGFLTKLNKKCVKVVINPWHTFSFRYEINLKRKMLSQDNRVVIGVWNRSRLLHHESRYPWCVYANGECRTQSVEILPHPIIPSRLDVMAGVIEV